MVDYFRVRGCLCIVSNIELLDSENAIGREHATQVLGTQDVTQSVSSTQSAVPDVSATPMSAPSGAKLKCDIGYTFGYNGEGNFSIQHACASSTGPWGFKISSSVCSIVTSSVAEHGMSWTRNGSGQPRQAPHTAPCSYQFHGTYNPDKDNDHITYADQFDFDWDDGTGYIKITGDFITTGTKYVKEIAS